MVGSGCPGAVVQVGLKAERNDGGSRRRADEQAFGGEESNGPGGDGPRGERNRGD
eukprot:NODE_1821_length_1290_cov_4.809831_g1507_i0.p6 GENE.NODE_1821_length_1290_cov_4.809831_g1507_i0~~NODE_1821_length_1290_cov_4.809831_g1507_i0.p6  ORF type:complete len:55 (-),score=0.81 NODE_1821_length_1290_cov_4.809831_g1507_i0:786-950(-)